MSSRDKDPSSNLDKMEELMILKNEFYQEKRDFEKESKDQT